ncbi:FAD/NAD(P)-binding protein [Streptomyces murinus]
MRAVSRVLCQVIGCGPAALGLALAADRRAELPRLLAEGVEFLDRSPTPTALSGLRFPFQIDANSVGRDFFAGVRPDGTFATVLNGRAGRMLRERHDRQVPLTLVGEFVNDLSGAVEDVLPGRFRYGADVKEIHLNRDGCWTSVDGSGSELVTSESVVLATGGFEDTEQVSHRYGLPPDRLIGSAELMSGRLDKAARILRSGGRIAILGGSHSGFAAARLLLDRFGDEIPHGALVLVHRNISLSYADLAESESVPPDLVGRLEACPESGVINRFHGLRSGPRDLCLRALQNREPRLILCETGSAEARTALTGAGLVVHALGYRTRSVPLFDRWGERIPTGEGTVDVDDRCRVLDAGLNAVPGIFGIGLGYARTDVWGRRRVGINTFHGEDAERIVSQVLAATTVENAAPAR